MRNVNVTDELRYEVFNLWEQGGLSVTDVGVDKELQQIMRSLAKSDLYFHCKFVLGYHDLSMESHYGLCRYTQNLNIKRQLALLPRGTYKSTIRTIGFGTYAVINDPNVSIFLIEQTADNASKHLLEIEQHFEINPMMEWLFPELMKPSSSYSPWNSQEFKCPARTVISGNPTMMAVGVGRGSEGRHFPIILVDDIIGEEAQKSEKVMNDAIIYHDGIDSFFVKPSTGIYRGSGTRWGLNDLYGVLIKDPEYSVYHVPAIDVTTNTSNFPDILPLTTLEGLKRRNYAKYMSQYQNDPHNPEALDFRPDQLNTYFLIDTPKGPACEMDGEVYYVSDMNVILALDPAARDDVTQNMSKNAARGRVKKANNAIVFWGAHPSGFYFLLDCYAGRPPGENPERELMLELHTMFVRWKGYVRKGYLESFGMQTALLSVWDMICIEKGERFMLEPLPKATGQSKIVRIRAAIGTPAFDRRLCIRPGHYQFRNEFEEFPQSPLVDVLDASGWAISVLRKPLKEEKKRRKARQAAKEYAKRMRFGSPVTGY